MAYDSLAFPWTWQPPSPSAPPSLWRYLECAEPVTRIEGWTPLLPTADGIWIKDEGRNPNGTFHDRIASLLLTAARQARRQHLAYTGPDTALAASLSVYAALAGIPCAVPDSPNSTAHQHLLRAASGAEQNGPPSPLLKPEELDHATQLALQTLALEICEQLEWRMPGCVVFPGLSPSLVQALVEGFDRAVSSGWVPTGSAPRIVTPAIEAATGAVSANAFRQGLALSPEGAVGLRLALEFEPGTVVVNPRSALAASEPLARLLRIHRYPRRMPVGGIITPQ